jgi:Trypsin
MSHLRSAFPPRRRRLLALLAAPLAVCACVLAPGVSPAVAASPGKGAAMPFIVGGQEASISQFPWQVFVLLVDESEGIEASCGGSILDPSHVLTAAHCVDHEGTTNQYPLGDFRVVAGASNVQSVLLGVSYPPGSQHSSLTGIRTHPYYMVLPNTRDDVAVLTLKSPLTLSTAANAQAIPLATTGVSPSPGAALSVSGYGKQSGAEGSEPNGRLYWTSLTALSSDACRELVGVNSAVLLCAVGPSSATCQGDSGGPLTEGSPAVQVGIVDFGPKACPVGQPSGFSNVAAPEVRAFIEGSEAPPVAARPTSPPVIKWIGAVPVEFGPLTCDPGGWSGSPSFTYTFQTDTSSPLVLQSGPNSVYAPPSSLIGFPLVCIVQAANPGGVTTLRSGTTPPIALDTAPPASTITGLRCSIHACTLSIAASDPHGLALSIQSSASYVVSTKCPAKRRNGRKRAKPPVCHRTKTVRMPLKAVAAGAYQAVASGLPYNERVTFTVAVTDAAGLHPARLPMRSATLHPPKKKRKTKPKHGR